MSHQPPGGLIDVTVPLVADLPLWPGSPGFSTRALSEQARGDTANASELRTDVHCGTHVDAPRHFVTDGATVEDLRLETLCGAAFVADVPDGASIGPADLDKAAIPADARRLLLRTSNSRIEDLYSTAFRPGYSALSPEGAAWVRARGIEVVGIDYLSIQRFDDPPDCHTILLEAGIAIIEGLALAGIVPGWYELLCFPVLLAGAEAAPARVALRPLSSEV